MDKRSEEEWDEGINRLGRPSLESQFKLIDGMVNNFRETHPDGVKDDLNDYETMLMYAFASFYKSEDIFRHLLTIIIGGYLCIINRDIDIEEYQEQIDRFLEIM